MSSTRSTVHAIHRCKEMGLISCLHVLVIGLSLLSQNLKTLLYIRDAAFPIMPERASSVLETSPAAHSSQCAVAPRCASVFLLLFARSRAVIGTDGMCTVAPPFRSSSG